MEWVKLGELVDIKTGKLNANAAVPNGKYPFFTTAQEISYIDSYSYDDEVVLVAGNGDLNVKYYEGKFDAYQRTYILTKKENVELNLKFLYFFMSDYVKILRSQSIGGVIKYIKLENLTEAKIPLLSFAQQTIIVDMLNKAESLKEFRKEQIKVSDNLIESLFFEMFGDFKTIDDNKKIKLSEIVTVRSSSRVFKKDLLNKGIDFYRGQEISNLSNNEFEKSQYFISEELYEEMKEKSGVPKVGDLLLPSIASDGQIWVVDTNEKFYFKDGRVLWISIDDGSKINSIYLKFILRDMFKRDFNNIASGTTFKELKIFLLKDLEVTYVPIELQNKFADYVIKIEEEKKKLNSSLKELEDLFDALLQNAFSGNLFKDWEGR